ncbi:MAG: hypothetical protein IJP66_00340 [Kiritimatiellae bacterium]|nr:hypothetical protein [Kiritimatiellia bacterium]
MTDDLLNPPPATPGDEGHLHLTLSPNDAPDAAPHGRLILHAHEPDGDSRPESDAEVVAGVRSLFGGGSGRSSSGFGRSSSSSRSSGRSGGGFGGGRSGGGGSTRGGGVGRHR